MRATMKRSAWIGVVCVAVLVAPHVLTSPYWRGILVLCAINVMLAMALNVVLGYTGQLNLGQSGFFALGAYASAILVQTYHWSFWLAVIAASLLAALAGLFLAAFAVRLKGHYLGIASLGFAVIIYQGIVNWEDLTQGVRGMYGIMPPPDWTIPGVGDVTFSDPVNLFYLVAGIAVIVYVVLGNILRSPIGRTLLAVREDEISAASLGIDTRIWKAFAFALGSGLAGLAGCFYPILVGTLVPDAFGIVESFSMLATVVVGGLGTMIGPVIGATVLTLLPEVLRGVGELRLIIYGLALTLVVLFMPGGLVQAYHLLRDRTQSHRAARAERGVNELS